MIRGMIWLVLAVAAGLGVFVASGRASFFGAQIVALHEPSNADIYPLENAMLSWFAGAVVLQVLVIVFAVLAGRRFVRRR